MNRVRCGLLAVCSLLAGAARADESESAWIDLTERGLAAWQQNAGDWLVVGNVYSSAGNLKALRYDRGEGVLLNGPKGKTLNLKSKEDFGSVEAHLEFLVPKGSNAGVKFEGLYEVQILDSYGKRTVKATDCGGIYPHADLLPKYHYLDEGYPPKVNAAKPPGEWQTLDVVFRAPRFDAEGKKVANARFDRVVLNGQVVQENIDLASPTGHFYKRKEVPAAPLLLQADHGPVAFRKIRVRRLAD